MQTKKVGNRAIIVVPCRCSICIRKIRHSVFGFSCRIDSTADLVPSNTQTAARNPLKFFGILTVTV